MINLDEGYMFGVGAFETILVYNKSLVFIDEHIKRLNKALKFLNLSKTISSDNFTDYLKNNDLPKHGILKIMVSKENILFTQRQIPYNENHYKKGFKIKVSEILRNETSPFTYIKSLNYADNIWAKKNAVNLGYDDSLFLNTKQEICETSSANIFLIKDGVIYTPPKKSGLLAGIIRRYLLSNYDIKEKIIKYEDINQYQEIFISNSVMGIMPVKSIEDYQFYSFELANSLKISYGAFLKNSFK